jgi:hypothetical protein
LEWMWRSVIRVLERFIGGGWMFWRFIIVKRRGSDFYRLLL